jgi:hypothetical protein
VWVQPGIESLHSDVLKLMDKGIQGWQNIQLLKWLRELGLRLFWSVLWGFPGEKDDWYTEMAPLMPALEHLPPPFAMNRIRFDRYSVYHQNAQRHGLILFPIGSMSYIYPVGGGDLDGLAYYFATEPGAGPLRYADDIRLAVQNTPGAQAVFHAVREWRTAHAHGPEPVLEMEDRDGVLRITDTRSCARVPRHELTGLARAVLLTCDNGPREGRLAETVAKQTGLTAAEDEIAGILDGLLADRLVVRIDGRLLSVVLKIPIAPLLPPDQFPGGHVYVQPMTAEVAR